MKKYGLLALAFAFAAPVFTGCNNGLDEYPSDAPVPAPSDKFTTSIQFVSRLSDATLCANASDNAAIDRYIVTTLDGKAKSWLTVLDRADNGNLSAMLSTAVSSYRWTSFAFNRVASATAYQGSMLYFNQCITESKGVPSGSGCYVTGITTRMTGTRTDKNDIGEVSGTSTVAFDVNFLTAHFETAEQITAFGGRNGVLRSFYDANMPILMVGTVKNDQFNALVSAAQTIGSNYAVKVTEVAVGGQYTLFMLSEERFWGFNGVTKTSLVSGIDAYEIGVMW